ncbi:MAG: CBS domain-containing protein [Deltaproteobacteria bacterium]|nr:MAG: CBS domain-containing protein [Deltaproteobacteria bacterium]
MTASPHTIGAEQNIELASKRMNDLGIRHLPVLKGGKLVGIISDRDIRLVEALESVDPGLILVQDVMSPEIYSVSPDASMAQVCAHMAKQKFGSAVIVEKEVIVGIFTTIDALRAFSDHLLK